MNRNGKKGTKGPVWRTYCQELRRKRVLRLIRCIVFGGVAWFAMKTEQAALWLTWPVLCWSLCTGAVTADLLLEEER